MFLLVANPGGRCGAIGTICGAVLQMGLVYAGRQVECAGLGWIGLVDVVLTTSGRDAVV